MAASLHLLVCKYYLREAQSVVQGRDFENVTVSAFPDVCVHPQADRRAVTERLSDNASADGRTVVPVGACFLMRNDAPELAEHGFRRNHCNDSCFHLLVNMDVVDGQVRAGAYLVTPGWLESWPQHMYQWRFDQCTARAFFVKSASKVVLLDTGVDPETDARLRAFSDLLGLPAEVIPVGLDRFRLELLRRVQDWRLDEARRDAAMAVEQANAELEQFVSVASHDLQAPLRRLTAFGELLEADAGPGLDTAAREDLNRMRKSAARMQRLIDGLLAYSRITTQGNAFGIVRLAVVVRQVVADLAPRIEACGGRVEVGELPTVRADELQMHLLFQHLIGNALKFVAVGCQPMVRVAVRSVAPGMMEIAVADNGIGFDEAQLGKLFKPFHRLHSEDEYPGSGIGLAICRKIVQRHSGTITAHSRPGEGATFVVTLPEGGDGHEQGSRQ